MYLFLRNWKLVKSSEIDFRLLSILGNLENFSREISKHKHFNSDIIKSHIQC